MDVDACVEFVDKGKISSAFDVFRASLFVCELVETLPGFDDDGVVSSRLGLSTSAETGGRLKSNDRRVCILFGWVLNITKRY